MDGVYLPEDLKDKIEVGDRVEFIGNKWVSQINKTIRIVESIEKGVGFYVSSWNNIIKFDCSAYYNLSNIGIKLIKNVNKNNMNLIEKIKEATLKEPEKSFRKCGVTGADGELTDQGTEAFIQWLFEQNKDKFNEEVVQPILKEDKE